MPQNLIVGRRRLKKLAKELTAEQAEEIENIIKECMRKRSPNKAVARAKQVKLTRDLIIDVLDYVEQNPHLHNRIIGRHFGIDGGRVAEIIQGDRTPDFPEGTPEFRNRYL